jgi:hypothetical protein
MTRLTLAEIKPALEEMTEPELLMLLDSLIAEAKKRRLSLDPVLTPLNLSVRDQG